MKICMVSDADLHSGGGTNEVIFNLATKLLEMGHSVTMVAPEHRPSKQVSEAPAHARKVLLPLEETRGLIFVSQNKNCFERVVQEHRKHRFDVLHQFQVVPLGPACVLLRATLGVPLVSGVMGTDSFSPVPTLSYWLTRPIAALVMNSSDVIVSPSNDLARRVEENRWRRKIQVIPHGVDAKRFGGDATSPSTHALRTQLGLEAGESVILSVARPASVKSLETLVRAAPMVLRAHRDARFVVVGGGLENSYAAELTESLGVRNSFRFVGPVQRREIPPFYAATDIFVLTSLYETFGLAVLEAMASGRPVIATNVGAIPEIVVDSVTGYLFPPGHFEILADLIIKLLDDRKMRLDMGRKARERANSSFGWDAVARRYDHLYETLCKQRKQFGIAS